MSNNPIIIYEKHGGIRNLHNRHEIYSDGIVHNYSLMGGQNIGPLQSHITSERLKDALELFNKNDFFSMKDSYSPDFEPKLLLIQQLTYKGKNVNITNGGNPPIEFRNIVEGIEAIVR